MEPRRGYLTQEQLAQLEAMPLEGKEAHVRDAFLFCCYTGLRFSDFRTLTTAHIRDDWLRKKMIKTGYIVEVPLRLLFQGKALAIIARYGTVEKMVEDMDDNSTVNKTLHHITARLSLPFKPTFHTSRHTFATLLLQQGVNMPTIQQLLGHRNIETTAIYGERDRRTLTRALEKTKETKQQKQ